jgi:N-acetylmuramic acid 6-phosphate etherase
VPVPAEPVTEGRDAGLADLDLRPTRELVALVNEQDHRVAPAVAEAGPALATAIDAIVDRLRRGGRLVYVGAGTSGRLASVDAAECGPTFGIDPGLVIAVVAGGADAIATAQEAAEDDVEAAAADIAAVGVGPLDAVVALSASGRTPYTLAALRAAADAGALTVAVTCAPSSPLGAEASHEVAIVVGPELIAGSTRMKAGTAQKLALNTISTVSMVRLGKTYGNLMVDVVATNAKLHGRVRRAVAAATGVTEDEAAAAVDAADGEGKVAIVALLSGLPTDEARRRLEDAGGVVRQALERA